MLNRRHLTRLLVLIAWIVTIAGCSASRGPDRAQEQRNCESISQSGQQVTQCLVLKYDWNADSAVPAGRRFQWTLDSLRAEHERQAAAVLADQQARAESVLRAQEAKAESLRMQQENAALARAGRWAVCILKRDRPGLTGPELYEPCKSLLPSRSDYLLYKMRHDLPHDAVNALDYSFLSTELLLKRRDP